MRSTLAMAVVGGILALGCLSSGSQADEALQRAKRSRVEVAASPYCREVERCGPAGCQVQRICTRPCPDGYSCYPLYGAYGPYGGMAYWGSYTDTGWGYFR